MRLVIFTDLDGTLLDHDTYSFEAARPALDAIQKAGIPLVLASSKTAAEMRPLQAELGIGDWPLIVENGAGVLMPGVEESDDGGDYHYIRRVLKDLAEPHFRGFGDMSDEDVAELTGLSREKARLARTRRYSEPGLFDGREPALDAFCAALDAQRIAARSGGRFLTLSMGRTKADGMKMVAAKLGAQMTLALGDAPNDTEMLETADRGVIVRNVHGKEIDELAGERDGTIVRTQAPGPEGWNQAVLSVLNELGLNDAGARNG
ncbi:HAD-IIB family hydrolase [Tepidamorphus sp. 3E244]|uniref:HAD-IIB family hydrolase n=1 Tax=Tepidamorphus sp. 3E244 TaxID=3385498 RepID=UPI0038FC7DE9